MDEQYWSAATNVSNVMGGRVYVDAASNCCVCGAAELEGERCYSVWYTISVESRGIRETAMHGKDFVVGDNGCCERQRSALSDGAER